MTKEQFAEMITGVEYPFRLTKPQRKLAADNRLLVVYGASDDLCEIDGAETDETGASGIVFLTKEGKIMVEPDDDESDVLDKFGFLQEFKNSRRDAIRVELLWCKEGDYSWTLRSDTPHATFEIAEDGEPFCRGLVIDLKECAI